MRKKVEDKKVQICSYIEKSVIAKKGGKEALKRQIKESVYISTHTEKVKYLAGFCFERMRRGYYTSILINEDGCLIGFHSDMTPSSVVGTLSIWDFRKFEFFIEEIDEFLSKNKIK